MKLYPIVLMFLGIIITVIGYYREKSKPSQKVIYKFIGQSLEEADKSEQEDVYNKFIGMFVDPPLIF